MYFTACKRGEKSSVAPFNTETPCQQVHHCVLQEDYVEGENDGKTQEACLQKFSSRDYIMEPAIFNTLKT